MRPLLFQAMLRRRLSGAAGVQGPQKKDSEALSRARKQERCQGTGAIERKELIMSLYRQAGSKVFWYDFHFDGQRIRESTKTTNIERARKMERKRRQKLEENTASIQKPERPKLFSTAAEAWMEAKKPKWAPRMYRSEEHTSELQSP